VLCVNCLQIRTWLKRPLTFLVRPLMVNTSIRLFFQETWTVFSLSLERLLFLMDLDSVRIDAASVFCLG
jgi:hypothetical protein